MNPLTKSLSLATGLLASLSLAAAAEAQPVVNRPASQLEFPLVDSRPGHATIISITNTNTDRTVCPEDDNFRAGDVALYYCYLGAPEGSSSQPDWRQFDRIEILTPGDTLTVLSNTHNPEAEVGDLFVQALDPKDEERALEFNYLIGSALLADADLGILWSYEPYGFRSHGGTPDGCHVLAGYVDAFPDTLFVDSFFEERAGAFENRLALTGFLVNDYETEVSVLFWNNREDRFSRTFRFRCWTQIPLSAISSVARSLNGDPDEFLRETGWVSLRSTRLLDRSGNPVGGRPPILGVFMQTVRGDFTSGHTLHFTGTLGVD